MNSQHMNSYMKLDYEFVCYEFIYMNSYLFFEFILLCIILYSYMNSLHNEFISEVTIQSGRVLMHLIVFFCNTEKAE